MSRLAVATGLDCLLASGCAALRGQRLALLVHPASVDTRLRHAVSLLHAAEDADLRCLLGPQHGLRGETQDNMIEWRGYPDPVTGLPVYSLYGEVRRPTTEMLAEVDTVVVDLQDVGARYYTFVWTLLHCMQACAASGKRVLVLDRPNPIAGSVEGNILDPAFSSFVGLAPIPMRHGLSMGELALFCRHHFDLDVDLQVLEMRGWRRSMYFEATALPWVLPSPNLPTVASTLVYPGFCLLEGTELSEGRGTTRPFEIFGAPYIDPDDLVAHCSFWELPGCRLRPLHFEPTFQKYAGKLCGGAQVHVTDRAVFEPVLTATAVLATVRALWPDDFAWRQPPYEYEEKLLPIDILAGTDAFRLALEAGASPWDIREIWQAGLKEFQAETAEFRRYE